MQVICKIRHGSYLYGTNTPTSDVDYKGVYMPSFEDVVLGKVKDVIDLSTNKSNIKNTKDDVDEQYFSLPYFIKMLASGETIAIDMIHANEENTLVSSPEWEYIVANRSKFYTKKMKSFLGYCKRQAAKYGIKGSRINALNKVKEYLLDKKKHGYIRLDDNPLIEFGLQGISHSESFMGMLSDGSYSVDEINKIYDDSTKHVEIIDGFDKNGEWIDKRFLVVCESKYEFTMKIDDVITSIDKKLASYGERAQEAKNNLGVDWKALHHAVRAGFQLIEIYETGDLKYPLKEADYLLKVKNGLLPFNEVQQKIEEVIDKVTALALQSPYEEVVDKTPFEQWIVGLYRELANE